MKKLTFILVMLCAILASAQNWEPTYENALLVSKAQNKPIILVFSGSDWCAPCIKMDRDIWQSEEFKAFADQNYVLYKADFPRKKTNQLPEDIKAKNGKLASTYNPKGYFPLVVVLDSSERTLGKAGFKKLTPKQYISLFNSFIQ